MVDKEHTIEEDALLNLTAFKAKYQKRYPEAIRSLCETAKQYLQQTQQPTCQL